MANTFYIVRHGQTNWNILGKTQGHGNSDLTEKGIEQATELADSLAKNHKIDYIFSSDLGRAVQTANILGDSLGISVCETPDLREMGFGKWEGLLIDEIKMNYADIYNTWRNEPHLVEIPEGETLHIIKDRVDNFINELNKKYDNKHILLVTHSVTVRVMLLSFLNSGMENIYRIKQDNTALNIVEYRDYGPVIIKMNDTTHIKNNEKINNSALE
ncbi:histidine phosphatase family protein [Paraclostridium bifermentans]|uniref:histidine phosphatase family protein n=1 Tax=Paraclostridium bifermentans TaxID=1490 RepID=UPI0006B2F83D|nr:histidine phosphatase family protein [Paraclostridium bifermentans]OSB12121.1 histidine phosphatase family protein [Paraclostridium bifermentans]